VLHLLSEPKKVWERVIGFFSVKTAPETAPGF
jgi:hypothetical protein